MKKTLLFFIGLLIIVTDPLIHSKESAPYTSEIVKKIQNQYQATQSLEANFVQVNHYEGFTKTFTSKGHLYIKRPGKLRWDYTEPIKQQVFVNENKVWVYVPEHQQAILSPLAQENDSQLPIHLLSWAAQLELEFDVHTDKETETLATLTLIPKEARSGPRKITLEIDPKTALIQKITLYQTDGNTATFTFTQIKINPTLEDPLFVFTPPKGVEVVQP
ncbi:MAG TPA: outer membrane lipoprotein chaperone LolA [Nitrospiria bacterium]|jgi:outer membrane lipoprotein carrier protein|nr:outer membrane lipoprotein chaperone LolA [Nitrospiria bacterium]